MLPRLTDFEPCCVRIQSEFGRLMPIGVAGDVSPDSITTVITRPVMPLTSAFLWRSKIGERSSNHCASLAIASMRFVATASRNETTDSNEPRMPSGS